MNFIFIYTQLWHSITYVSEFNHVYKMIDYNIFKAITLRIIRSNIDDIQKEIFAKAC